MMNVRWPGVIHQHIELFTTCNTLVAIKYKIFPVTTQYIKWTLITCVIWQQLSFSKTYNPVQPRYHCNWQSISMTVQN